MDVMSQMKDRISKGQDPLTGTPFKTCGTHKVERRGDSVVCHGCGAPVRLDERGAWEHAK